MLNAVERDYNGGMFESTLKVKDNTNSAEEQWLTSLIASGLKGDQDKLWVLATRFHDQPQILQPLIAYLKRWYAGRLNGLDTIPGLLDEPDNEAALALILNAFEHKLRGASDLTLLYLLSLTDHPVPQQHMKNVFRSTLMERWLTKRDDYVRFLGPLGRLNEEHWHWVIENLRRLQLLEAPIAGQYDLLFVGEPIRQYFRSNLRERSQSIYEQANEDMRRLFQDTVIDFRQRFRDTPEIKTWISPELQESLGLEEEDPRAILWKPDELDTAQNQLSALRHSLCTLKAQAQRLTRRLSNSTQPGETADLTENPASVAKQATTSTGQDLA